MASTRALLRTIVSTRGPVRQFWHHHYYRRELPVISNMIERWEKEFNHLFERMKKSDLTMPESNGLKKFHLSCNVHGFQPEEIKIKTHNGTLTISARKEKHLPSDQTYTLQEFSQTYALPKGIKVDDLKSTYTENGVLSIEAPLSTKEEHSIKIERI